MDRKHLILMTIGCLIPVAVLAALYLFEIKLSTAVMLAIFLICPAMHFWMMKDHGATGASHHKE